MIKVYDKVHVMRNNTPTVMVVFAVIESMSHLKTGTEVFYKLVDGTFGVGWGNNEGVRFCEKDMFKTRSELINSL